MRIAMFTNNYKPFIAGVPISIERLSKGLKELGHEVVIFAPDYGNCEDEEGVIRYRTLYRKDDKGIAVGDCFDSRIGREFARESFDAIHAHHPMISGYAALYMGRKNDIPVAYTYHTRYEEYLHHIKIFQTLEQGGGLDADLARYGKEVLVPRCVSAFANACDLVFAPTKMMEDCLAGYGTKSRIAILPTGLEDRSFMADPAEVAAINHMYRGEKPFLFSTVARLEKEKNMDFLLRGLARLKERIGDSFRLMVIGDGSQRKQLEALAAQLGVEGNVAFVGKVENSRISAYQFASDLFLFASKSETQGIVLLEAMAAGCPVVALRASGVVDVVRDGENGYMAKEDEDEWAMAAAQAVLNRERYPELRRGAAATAAQYRSLRIAAEAERQYEWMIGRRRKRRASQVMNQAVMRMDWRRLFRAGSL